MKFIDRIKQYKENTCSASDANKKHVIFKSVCIFPIAILIMLLASVVVIGGVYVSKNRILVNDNAIPELDPMYKVDANKLGIDAAYNDSVILDINDYDEIQEKLGISLADTILEDKNPYIFGTIHTDDINAATIRLENYILGDTSNYIYCPERDNSNYDLYTYDPGEEFYSPISLEVDIILSTEQEEYGWSEDFLGMYEYYDSYKSDQGYRVCLLQETSDSQIAGDQNMRKKIAIFVADGIRYKLSGKTSFDNMKHIVNSML